MKRVKNAKRKKGPASTSIKALAGNQWFVVALIDRGPNVQTVNMIEIGAGGDPSRATPYEVAAFQSRPPADNLVHRFQAAGATAEVRVA